MGTDDSSNPEVEKAVARLATAYYRVLLVVGDAGSGKTRLLRRASADRGWPFVNLGLELSRRLLSLTHRQRKLEAADLVADILAEQSGPVVVVDDTEIIFEPSLKLNPLGLLHVVSRRRPLIWSCPGRIEGGYLVHAQSGHREHHRIPVGEFQVYGSIGATNA